MRTSHRILSGLVLLGALGGSLGLGLKFHGGSLWEGLRYASAAGKGQKPKGPEAYDLSQLRVVNEVLKLVRDRYVDPKRVKPREMLIAALNQIQRDVAQVLVHHDEATGILRVQVDAQQRDFRVDDVKGPWDVSARLREVFLFLQQGLKGTEVDLRDVEYAACNGMLHTLDPHSSLLSPEGYKEMNASTSGQFGGLGFVISMRKQQLTVIKPMRGTPAYRAGIKRGDQIVKIENESTLNMGLNEAVSKLRGEPRSKVTIWLQRDGWPAARPFELQREIIKVDSVESKLLEGGVGYIRLKQFQQRTADDLGAALDNLRAQNDGKLRGVILDLRGNPGGLLDQSAKVVDRFVTEGPIVSTVGAKEKDVKNAVAEGTEPNYPLVLLVNGGSASASEIVAGALKNHDRALIVGETTFGKGSVQLVFPDLPDKAALKLTIGQYLTEPGSLSIQGVGVTPDIQVDPMTVDPLEMDLALDHHGVKERDLSRSLSNKRAQSGLKPSEVVRYSLPFRERVELRERGGDPDEDFQMDFSIGMARDLVTKMAPGRRSEQLKALRENISEVRRKELEKVVDELKKVDIDWSDAPSDLPIKNPPVPPQGVEVKVDTDRPNNEITAGDSANLRLTVTNKGTQTLYRLKATAKSDNALFDNKELVVGKLEPGKSKTVTIPLGWCIIKNHTIGSPVPPSLERTCSIPKDTLMRADGVRLQFEEARGNAPAETSTSVTIRALERPTFAYAYQVVDNRNGNGDGRASRGEGFTMYLTVKNIGRGKSFETQANIRNLSGDGLLLHRGRFDLSNMNPGEVRKVAFTFDIESHLQDKEAKVELSVGDVDLREYVSEKVRMPLDSARETITVASPSSVAKAKAAGASLLPYPDAEARAFGKLPMGTSVPVLGTFRDFLKVGLGDGRFAFVRASEVDSSGGSAAQVSFEDLLSHQPPGIEIEAPVLATREAKTRVKGVASDERRLLDAYIFLGSKKVFYGSNRNGADPKKLGFETELALRPGVNVVTIVARHSPDTTTRRTFIVRRDGPNGELLITPKVEEDLSSDFEDVD